MTGQEHVLAKKYATAFLNLYSDTISLDTYHTLKTVADYFKKNYNFFFLLNTPTVSPTTKRTTMIALLKQLHIPDSFLVLIDLVLKHQRLFLLPGIFEQIVRIYEQRKKILPFTFFSSNNLDNNQIEAIKKFLTQKTNFHIIYKTKLNKKLIAGMRLQSDVFLWEYSVAKQLRALRKTIR